MTTQANKPDSAGAPRGDRRFWGNREVPASKSEFFNAATAVSGSGESTIATIRMYGPIDSWGGWWGISTGDVGAILDKLPDSVEQIILRINSPGGEVSEAVAILNMLRAHKATVTAVVDGLAASAASVIAAGCDEAVMSPGTQMMIHSPWTFAVGSAADLRKTADTLDKFEAAIVEIYTGKAGAKDWAALLAEETWLTATEAVELGLADRTAVIPDAGEAQTAGADELIITVDPDGDDIEDSLTARIAASARRGSAEPVAPTTGNGGPTMSDQFTQEVRDRLGLPTDTSEDATLAALDEHLAAPAATVDAIVSEPLAVLPEGVVTIDAGQLEQLRADAAAGREARAEQVSAAREAAVVAAVNEGRIPPARADFWREQLAADPGAAEVLAALTPGLIPLDEVGITGGVDEAHDEATDSVFSKVYPNTQKED